MRSTATTCFLRRASGGARVRVDERGVYLGRGACNDIVLTSRAASTVHAIVRVGPNGPEILPLGRNATELNGTSLEGPHQLWSGDVITVPGEQFTVERADAHAAAQPTGWRAVDASGAQWGLCRAVSRAGGGDDDDLRLPGWPPAALTLFVAQGGLIVEAARPVLVNGVDAAGLMVVRDGDVLAPIDAPEHALTLRASRWYANSETTEQALPVDLAREIAFEFLPRGGLLRLVFDRGEVAVRLAEVRAALVAVLLGEGGGHAPGDWCPDELVLRRVWPGQDRKDRLDVNNLVHRLRANLVQHGLNPFALIERADGATRIRIAPGARVEVS